MAINDHESVTRTDWQKHEGFTLVSDVTFSVLRDLSTLEPSEVNPECLSTVQLEDIVENDYDPSTVALYVTSAHLANGIPQRDDIRHDPRFAVSRSDVSHGGDFAFEAGIGDLNFTWHFAPALAKAAVHEMVEAGFLDEGEVAEWRLSDWADIIGSGWFSRTAHTRAYTRNSVYGSFGRAARDYKPGALKRTLVGVGCDELRGPESLFDLTERIEPEDGTTHLTAFPSKQLTAALRRQLSLSPQATNGCPVARFSTRMPRALFEEDVHAQRLVDTAVAEVVPERSDDDEVMLRLNWSPIDATLATLANKLDQYEELYGTPAVTQYTSMTRLPGYVISHD